MTFTALRRVALGGLTVLTFVGSALAQAPAPLDNVEVQTLVARNTPDDNARLSAYFLALADRYTADATRHRAMAKGFVGNPSRNLVAGLNQHCDKLAKLNAESATIVRELAEHHRKLAAGATSTSPAGGEPFLAGRGAAKPTDESIVRLAETARTPGDHQAIATYFADLGRRYEKDIADHTAMARAYRGLPRDISGTAAMAAHCDRLAKLSRAAAEEAATAASKHNHDAAVAGR